jgi:hypothetical protein
MAVTAQMTRNGTAKKAARKRREKALSKVVREAKELKVVSARGSGEAGTRRKPKSTKDPKRAKAKPAVGSSKESSRRSLATQTRAAARKSKARPVKKATARGRR